MAVREKPDCPRCGYDLSAMPPTWKESCPVEGVCSECGSEFWWGEVLAERASASWWFVESHRAKRFPLPVFATLAMLFRPIRFWSSVPVLMPFRPLRIGYVICSMILLTPLLNGVVLALFYTTSSLPFGHIQSAVRMDIITILQDMLRLMWILPIYEHHAFGLLAFWVVLTPIAFLVMCASKQHKRIKLPHIARIWMYSIAILFTGPLTCPLKSDPNPDW